MVKIKLKEFELTKANMSKFKVADFERRIYGTHLDRIRKNIEEDKLLDNIITVIPEGNRFKIIDGQHRFYAFSMLLREKNIKSVSIMLRILEGKLVKNGREAYLLLDSAKALTLPDVLKVFDDGNNKFFNALRRFCSHYRVKHRLTFASALSSYYYAVTKNPFFAKDLINKALTELTPEDVHKLEYAIGNMYSIIGSDTETVFFKAVCFRNIVRLVFDNPELIVKQRKFQRFLTNLLTDKYIQNIVGVGKSKGSSDIFEFVYRYFAEKITPKKVEEI